jgi:hypothetical protein
MCCAHSRLVIQSMFQFVLHKAGMGGAPGLRNVSLRLKRRRMQDGYMREAFEVGIVESKNLPDPMCLHQRHEPCIMHLRSLHFMNNNQPPPVCKDFRRIRQDGEKIFDARG